MKKGRKIVMKNNYIIGRDLKSDISIPVPSVSRKHLIIAKEGNYWYIIDNNSMNGTFLNNYDNKIKKVLLKRDEILYLSTYKLNTNRIFDLINGKEKLQKITIDSDKILLGRDPKSDIFIDNPNISLHHAKIIKESFNYYIFDLKSKNGTFVNDILINNKYQVNNGDKITLGLYSFIFNIEDDDNLSMININQKGFRLDVKDIDFVVNTKDENNKSTEKTLLQEINLTIYPGEMVGLMGLSGAGKTTLLKILSGYNKPTNGEVFVNGKNLHENYNRIKNFIGYVPQDDIVHPELTVYEALYYSSKLRLSSDLSNEEVNKRIDKVLKDLGIFETRNVLIGSPDTQKGISGGQRKRVNIATELLANPELIFLDEPTSGLSSVDTKVVMDKLKKLSDSGKTIVLTIHQPSLKNYKKMDNMIILTHGEMAYFGSTYPESIQFFNDNNMSNELLSEPDNALLGLHDGEEKNKHWSTIYEQSSTYQNFVEKRYESQKQLLMKPFKNDTSNSNISQFKTLSLRYLNIKLKDKVNSLFLLIQAPTIALLLIFLFAGNDSSQYQETPSILLFILILSAVWFGVINSVREIVSEKAIYERERLWGLKIMPYLFSKFMILSLLSLIQVVLLLWITDYFINLTLPLEKAILIVFLTALTGLSTGLLISALSKTAALALTVVPIVLLPMIMFAGGMVPVKDMSISSYSVASILPTRWSFEAILRTYQNANENNETEEEPTNKEQVHQNTLFKSEAECTEENRDRCIEAFYTKEYEDGNKSVQLLRNNTNKVIYSVITMYILSLLLLTLFTLKRKDKN